MTSVGQELGPVMTFFAEVRAIGRSATDRGEFGEGGAPIWSLDEWSRFIAAARAGRHMPLLGNAIFKAVVNVERMIEAGKDARFIHQALFWKARQDDSEQAKKAVEERREEARIKASARAAAVEAQVEIERMRYEARERAKAEVDDRREHSSPRRRLAESAL